MPSVHDGVDERTGRADAESVSSIRPTVRVRPNRPHGRQYAGDRLEVRS